MSPGLPRNMVWIVALLSIAAVIVLAPFGPWILLAIWLGNFGRRLHGRITRGVGGRAHLGALLTVLILTLILVPLIVVIASLAGEAYVLVQRLIESGQLRELFERLVSDTPNGTAPDAPMDPLELLKSQGDRAWSIGVRLAGAASHAVLGLVVLFSGVYAVLVEGPGWYAWFEKHGPLTPVELRRFTDAFTETGRGLFFGIVGSGFAQAILATIAYFVIGVPAALALGLLTLMVSVIPAIGTALVWGPISIGLALADRPVAAIGLALFGMFVVGSVDNFVRPVLARRGSLQLPTYVVLLAMFGGIEVFGGWGLLLAPLVVRLAKEALMIMRDEDPLIVVESPKPVAPASSQ